MFCRVVERKSITETAKEAYLSQPAVTKQIRNLEMYYNAKLFNREHSKLVLTEPGRILYNYAKEIIAIERDRSEEHTSELQSRFDLVCRLLREKKKQ